LLSLDVVAEAEVALIVVVEVAQSQLLPQR
jgi:hypothetical protein